MQIEFKTGFDDIVAKQLDQHLGGILGHRRVDGILPRLLAQVTSAFDSTSTMDAVARMQAVASATSTPLLDAISGMNTPPNVDILAPIQRFRKELAQQGVALLQGLQRQYLDGSKGRTPASPYMGKTRAMYEYIRVNLGIRMHGLENLNGFDAGLHATESSVGQNVTKIYEVRLVHS